MSAGHWITTVLGNRFSFENTDERYYDIGEIAIALSRICRYSGHLRHDINGIFSVARHSLYVSHLVPEEHALAGLLHDAQEAYIGDLSRPLKRYLRSTTDAYDSLERRLSREIAHEFGFTYPLHESVIEADMRICKTESSFLMKGDNVGLLEGVEPYTEDELWEAGQSTFDELGTPDLWAGRFLRRYEEVAQVTLFKRAEFKRAEVSNA